MKSTELREEVKEFILSEVQMSVMRLGISAPLVLVVDKDYRCSEYLAIESAKFQTSPVLFKEVWISGVISVFDEDQNVNCYNVVVTLNYNWRSFRGGTNGTELGDIRFLVDKELPEKMSKDSAHYYVSKAQGIEI